MASRRYSIVITDPASGVVRSFYVPLRPAAYAVTCVLALPLLIGLGARWSAQAAIEELSTANAALQMANDNYRAATEQLSSQIAALHATVDDIGGRAAVDAAASRAMERLPASVKSRAMGGGSAMLSMAPVLNSTLGQADAPFGVLRDLLSVIETQLESVRHGVERRQALAASTPSIWPVAGWLSSAYGSRRDPFTGDDSFHPGLDISASHGQPVLATADGTVSLAGRLGNYGNLVVLDHGFGITTKYGHLSRFAVTQGQQVRRGDVIGYVGSTGRSTSAHLHYEIWVNDRLTNPLRLLGPR